MLIRKTFQGEIPSNKVVNAYTDSQTDTYSCSYVNEKNTYSTSEQFTGKYWIGGEPIYRIVYTFRTGSSSPSDFIIGDLPTNLNIVVSISAVLGNNVSGAAAPNDWNNETTLGLAWWEGKFRGRLKWGSLVNLDGVCIVEYTKTTD